MILHRNVEYLFPTPVGVAIIDPTKFDFKKYASLVFNSLTPENIEYMNANGVSPTVDDLHVKPEFQDLVKLVQSEVHTFFIEELGLDPNDLSMECMWANIQVNGCRHHIHLHPNSFYSGSLYLDIPTEEFADPGSIFFVDPRHAKQMQHANYTKVHGLSMRSKGIKPETGMLLMFPSWLEHGTDVCKVGPGKYRISLSFNYALRRADGMTMKLNLK